MNTLDSVESGALEHRVAALEERLAALEKDQSPASATGSTPQDSESSTADTGPGQHPSAQEAGDEDDFWILSGLEQRHAPEDCLAFAGQAQTPDGGRARYQWTRTAEHILEKDWSAQAEALGALGNPLRLTILRSVLLGTRTASDLVVELGLASTGPAYHHLHQLTATGWLESPTRGQYVVPATRRIPLLTILTALDATER